MSMVYVLIPAHNNKKEVLELLSCLRQQSYNDIRIILVDDGSTDGTEDEVKKLFYDVVVLKGNGNLWWTGANNLGVNYILAKAKNEDFILLLNNDLIVDRDYISNLISASLKTNRSIVGSTLADFNGRDLLAAGLLLDDHLNISVISDTEFIQNADFSDNVDVLSGRGTLIPVEVFKKIGSFNQKRLPHYGADYEFSVRAKRAGYRLVVSHKAIVYSKLNITGLCIPDKGIIPVYECFRLLFSKRSKAHIYYFLNYVWLCSEKGFRLRNTLKSGANILIRTSLKTIPGYPLYICMLSVQFFVRFFFMAYDFTTVEIENFALRREPLLKEGIIREWRLKTKAYYCFSSKQILNQKLKCFSPEEGEKILKLRRLSLNYFYKIRVVWDKVNARMVRLPR